MSSDWPVCPASETAAPHRMGAALTYARRYALFTLVGIAGEDDIDAPDLAIQSVDPGPQNSPSENRNGSNGVMTTSPTKAFHGHRKGANDIRPAVMSPEASAILRDRLLEDLVRFVSHDELDAWALHAWPKANRLIPADGDEVRQAFQARLGQLQGLPDQGVSLAASDPPADANAHSRIDKSVLTLPEAKRLKDKQHLRFVAKQPCLVCGREPSDPHHLRFAQSRGLGLKVSDEFAVPLCRAHHRELHRAGKEVDWWTRIGIEPIDIARRLWIETHPLMGSASHPDGASAALETKPPVDKSTTTAVPQQLKRMEMAKRTHLPGTPT
jgi:hypothetical protein